MEVRNLMQVTSAILPNGKVKNGVTKPYYITCDDGYQYVVKFKENPEGKRVLINEYICAKIAEILDLPLAIPSIIEVDDSFVNDYGKEISEHVECKISIGLHFGTRKIKKVFQIFNSQMLESALNIECIPEILLFDQLVCNKDRDNNGGNLLFDATNMKIIMIDHTHVFDVGPSWTANDLEQRIGEPFQIFDANGYVYRKLIPFVKGNNPFNKFMSKLTRLNPTVLWHIINSVPEEWQITDHEKNVLKEYLFDRLNRIEEVLPLLKPHLPYWKGGI